MNKLMIDPEFKNLIPPLTNEEYRQLEENVKAEGCRDALVAWNGIIVDGHNRYRICTENNIKFDIHEKTFAGRDNAVEWIIKNQFGRRNLNSFQKSELALLLKPVIQEGAKTNQKLSDGRGKKGLSNLSNLNQAINTREEIAKTAGVSQGTIAKTENILKKGTPEQIDRARKGGKGNSVDAIYREIREAKETRTCDECGRELPVSSFRAQMATCKNCQKELNRKMNELNDEELKATLFAEDKPVIYTVEMVIGELEANYRNAVNVLDGTLERNRDVVISSEENNKKVMAALSNAEAAIEKLKGKYSI